MSPTVKLGVPFEYPELLSVLGILAVAHGNLEMVQVMCLKTLQHMRPKEAIQKYRGKPSSHIREEINKVVEPYLKKGDPELKRAAGDIKNLIERARCLSAQRNRLIHCFWGCRDGRWEISPDETNWKNLPDVAIVKALAEEIQEVTRQLNSSRLDEDGAIKRLADQKCDSHQ